MNICYYKSRMPLTSPYRQAKSLYLRINHERPGGKSGTLPAILRTTQQTMKKIALIFLTVITLTTAYGKTDKHGNPVFNNELISEEKLEGFELTSSYYTIDNNISNKGSSVYVSDKPTLTDFLKFARELPSNSVSYTHLTLPTSDLV